MPRRVIRTEDAPSPGGCYSQAIEANGFVFTASLAGIDPKTGKLVSGGIEPQVRQALDNMDAILKAARTSLENVTQITAYLRSFDDFGAYNKAYSEYFDVTMAPARITVEGGKYPGEMAVQFAAIALLPDDA